MLERGKNNLAQLKEALVYQMALDNENENNGYSMSSRLIEATLDEGKHNIFGEIKDFSGHMPNVSKDGIILN